WGYNASGQLGNGTTTMSPAPVAVNGLTGVIAVSAGAEHSLALLGNGTVMAWGSNRVGQLGNGTSGGKGNVPAPVGELSGVTAISAGSAHSLALLGGGAIVAWGYNADGQLGDGLYTNNDAPIAVNGLAEVAGISAGGASSLSYGPPAPAIVSVNPNAGPVYGGTVVTITGTSFTGATAVNFGSTPAANFTVNSPTSITAVSPPGTSGTVDITTITPYGTSAISKHDHFRFEAPTITNISPNVGSTTGGASVTITGTGFGVGADATSFEFGKALAASVTCTTTTTCVVWTPAERAGTVDVIATVGKAKSKKTPPADQFTYNS
ncbi:MAG TPA: IPT/TIG domain-containing protein, partial [Solirubrobacteraceae bacterium]|nr:IPT/TIG domain-containing protein [Solirubrobacteraceae bacterium]